jgi:hypothetical protein
VNRELDLGDQLSDVYGRAYSVRLYCHKYIPPGRVFMFICASVER